ncbi:MAG: WG repeat-containing protein [Oscillospiraceae bacterium]|nr:WG repeat-containing protein [Oscillospiraceae bacterium]
MEKELRTICKDGKWGFVDGAGAEIIPCKWEKAGDFFTDLARVKCDGKWGFIDKTGANVIPCQYDAAEDLFDSPVRVKLGDRQGFIDRTGKRITPFQWEDARDFSDGLAAVKYDGKWGFINESGTLVIPCRWDYTSSFNCAYCRVKQNGKWGVINRSGKETVPCEWDSLSEISSRAPLYAVDFGRFRADVCLDGAVWDYASNISWDQFEKSRTVVHDGKWGLADETGALVTPCQWESIQDFWEGLAAVKQGGKWGFINKSGEQIVPCTWDYAGDFNDGLAMVRRGDKTSHVDRTGAVWDSFYYLRDQSLIRVKRGDKYGIILQSGAECTPCCWDHIDDLYEDMLGIKLDGKCGFIDNSGTEVIPCRWDKAGRFQDGLALVCLDDQWGLIDKSGTEVIPCKWDEILRYEDSLIVRQDDHWQKIDRTGAEDHSCRVDQVSYQDGYGIARIKCNGKYGFFWYITGEVISPCQWDLAADFHDGWAVVKKGDKWGTVALSGSAEIFCQWEAASWFVNVEHLRVRCDGKYGFIYCSSGKIAIPFRMEDAQDFREGFAKVKLDGKWVFVDEEGDLLWNDMPFLKEGMVPVNRYGRIGIINEAGVEVVPCEKWDALYRFADDRIRGLLYGQWQLITDGDMIPCNWEDDISDIYYTGDDIWDISDEKYFARVVRNGKIGVIDQYGRIMIPCQWDSLLDDYEGFRVQKEGRSYCINMTGNILE